MVDCPVKYVGLHFKKKIIIIISWSLPTREDPKNNVMLQGNLLFGEQVGVGTTWHRSCKNIVWGRGAWYAY